MPSSRCSALPAEETQYFRSNITDPDVVASWAETPDYTNVFPLVAVVGDRIVGNSTLHLGSGFTRHVAEIRIFLAKEFRRHGIGTAMIKGQIEMARKLGLHQVIAEVVESPPQVIHAFERLGFERQFALHDLFMTPDGETLDMIVLVNYLKRHAEEFDVVRNKCETSVEQATSRVWAGSLHAYSPLFTWEQRMTITIAVAGKGGTGKTTLSGLLVRYLVQHKAARSWRSTPIPAATCTSCWACH